MGAAYNLPSHLINIPIHTEFNRGDFISGISVGTSSQESYLTEFDMNVYYAITSQFITGINLASNENIIFNLHYSFYAPPKSAYAIVGGLTNIPINGDLTIQDYPDYNLTQNNAYSPYLVGSFKSNFINLHLGYGGSQFQYSDSSTALLSGLPGLIFGVEIPLEMVSFALEYDGKNLNAGSTTRLTEKTTTYISLTELLQSDGTNSQYNNQPQRWITIGIKHYFNKSSKSEKKIIAEKFKTKTDKLEKKIIDVSANYEKELDKWRNERNEIKNEINTLKDIIKNDLTYINETDKSRREERRQRYLSNSQEISEKVLALYYQSLEEYAKQDHYQAISTLQKAIILNPYLPELYIRLGSIYFDLNLNDMALLQWEKALELDPKNIRLQKFIEKI